MTSRPALNRATALDHRSAQSVDTPAPSPTTGGRPLQRNEKDTVMNFNEAYSADRVEVQRDYG
jgi:hypothetical protein